MSHPSCVVFCGTAELDVKWWLNLGYSMNTVANSREQNIPVATKTFEAYFNMWGQHIR